jgi:hypothetical protein
MGRVRRLAIGVILAVVIAAPILEMFDRWDQTLQDGNDSEINLVIVALCVGVALSLSGVVLAVVRSFARSRCRPVLTLESILKTLCAPNTPIPNSRPPTPLRV